MPPSRCRSSSRPRRKATKKVLACANKSPYTSQCKYCAAKNRRGADGGRSKTREGIRTERGPGHVVQSPEGGGRLRLLGGSASGLAVGRGDRGARRALRLP